MTMTIQVLERLPNGHLLVIRPDGDQVMLYSTILPEPQLLSIAYWERIESLFLSAGYRKTFGVPIELVGRVEALLGFPLPPLSN